MPTFQHPDGKITVQIFSVNGEINERVAPWFLEEGQTPRAQGWEFSTKGRAQKRWGVQIFQDVAINGSYRDARGAYSAEIFSATADKYVEYIFLHKGAQLYYLDAEDLDATTAVFSSLTEGGFTYSFSGDVYHSMVEGYCPDLYSAANPVLMKKTHLVHQTHELQNNPTAGSYLFIWNNSYNDTVGYTQPLIMPTTVAWLSGRAWLGNCIRGDDLATGWSGPGHDIWYSDLYAPADYNNTPIYVEPGKGGEIVALHPIRADEPAMLVFKKRAIFMFYPRFGTSGAYMGDAANTIDTVTSRIRLITDQYGCASSRTIKDVETARGSEIWFLSSDGHLRSLTRVGDDVSAGPGIPITYNTPDLAKNINLSASYDSSAAVYDGKYYLGTLGYLYGLDWDGFVAIFDVHERKLLSVELAWNAGSLFTTSKRPGNNKPTLFMHSNVAKTETSVSGTDMYLYRLDAFGYTRDPGAQLVDSIIYTPYFTHGTLHHRKAWDQFSLLVENQAGTYAATASFTVSYRISDIYSDPAIWTELGTEHLPRGSQTSFRSSFIRRDWSLADIKPSHFIQFKIEEESAARPAILSIDCTARVVPEESDNSMT